MSIDTAARSCDCEGKGWDLYNEDENGWGEVQRCDTCKRFKTDEDALEAALASGALHVSYRLVELEADDNAELRAERDRLLEILDACGGRNIEVAEEIDEINRQLGEDED